MSIIGDARFSAVSPDSCTMEIFFFFLLVSAELSLDQALWAEPAAMMGWALVRVKQKAKWGVKRLAASHKANPTMPHSLTRFELHARTISKGAYVDV